MRSRCQMLLDECLPVQFCAGYLIDSHQADSGRRHHAKAGGKRKRRPCTGSPVRRRWPVRARARPILPGRAKFRAEPARVPEPTTCPHYRFSGPIRSYGRSREIIPESETACRHRTETMSAGYRSRGRACGTWRAGVGGPSCCTPVAPEGFGRAIRLFTGDQRAVHSLLHLLASKSKSHSIGCVLKHVFCEVGV